MGKNGKGHFCFPNGISSSFLFLVVLSPCSVQIYGQFEQFFGQQRAQNYRYQQQQQYPPAGLQYATSDVNSLNGNNEIQRQNSKGPADSMSIRLIDEILEIFVPPNTYSPKRTPREDSQQQQQQPLLPYGLNQLLPPTLKSRDSATLADIPTNFGDSERRFQPIKTNRAGISDQQAPPWANLAREVLGLFNPLDTTTTTTTTAATTTAEMSLFDRFMPKIPNLFNSFGGGQTAATTTAATPATLFPFLSLFTETPTPTTMTTKAAPMPWLSFLRQEQQQPKHVDARANAFLEPLSQIFGVEKKAVEEGRAQIDTGGPNGFDRFVVRERMAPDNPFLGLVGGGKWNEKGIKWDDGNIQFVNKNGNTLLGSEIGVNDRSVDIPLMRWLGMANNFASSYQAQPEDERVKGW